MVSEGEGTAERCEGEHREAGLRDPPVADDFSQRGERQQGDQNRELIGIDHPHRSRMSDAKAARDRGERDVGDGAVEHGHADGEQDRHDRPVAARTGKAVVLYGWQWLAVLDAQALGLASCAAAASGSGSAAFAGTAVSLLSHGPRNVTTIAAASAPTPSHVNSRM